MTAAEMIEALQKLPPETNVRAQFKRFMGPFSNNATFDIYWLLEPGDKHNMYSDVAVMVFSDYN